MTFYIIGVIFIWRILLFFISFLGGIIFVFSPSFPYSDIYLTTSGLPYWIWSFANFDGVHYLTIVQKGYWAQFTQVFFPSYPLLIKFLGLLMPFFNNILIGVSISTIFFFLAIIIFWKLLSLDYKADSVKWILLFLVVFPASFFFGAMYTESLFLFLILASFYLARKGKWVACGILGASASATKLIGICLLPALLWEWQQQFKIKNLKFKITNKNSKLHNYFLSFLHFACLVGRQTFCILHSPILYLAPLGLLSYMLYLQLRFGDFLYFWHAQPAFGAERSGGGIILLPQVIWRYVKILTAVPLSNYKYWAAFWELSSMVVGCWLLVVAWIKKIRASYLIFSLLAIIIPTLTGTFSSMPRYILVAFPMYIVLGLIKKKSVKILLSFICCLLLAIFTILFTRGYWVA